MSTPVRTDRKIYFGADGVPTNDTNPIGGSINLASPVSENVLGNLFGNIRLGSVDEEYYTVFYARMEHTAPGLLTTARVYARTGAKLNSTSGTATIVSTNANDNGRILITGKVAGVWTQETLTLTGTTPVIGAIVWDSSTVVRWEALDGVPEGSVTCAVNSVTCGVIWGTDADPQDSGTSIATYMATAEIALALASAKNSALSSANRLTAPTSISAFSQAVKWTNNDESINVPSGEFAANDYIGICARFTAYANVPAPNNQRIQFKIGPIGDAQAS